MSTFGNTKRAILWLVVVVLLSGAFWQWHRYATGQTLISDAELIEIFHRNRSKFDQALHMAAEDNLMGRVGLTYFDDKNLLAERVGEYRSLMREADVRVFVVYRKADFGGASFWIDSQGAIFAGRSKGIAYFPEPPNISVLSSLDRPCLTSEGPDAKLCAAVRNIEGNWWLIREDNR